jgi:hypothetical protein
MVAFLAEDGLIKLSLNTTRQKARNLLARPRVTLLIPTRPALPHSGDPRRRGDHPA